WAGIAGRATTTSEADVHDDRCAVLRIAHQQVPRHREAVRVVVRGIRNVGERRILVHERGRDAAIRAGGLPGGRTARMRHQTATTFDASASAIQFRYHLRAPVWAADPVSVIAPVLQMYGPPFRSTVDAFAPVASAAPAVAPSETIVPTSSEVIVPAAASAAGADEPAPSVGVRPTVSVVAVADMTVLTFPTRETIRIGPPDTV